MSSCQIHGKLSFNETEVTVERTCLQLQWVFSIIFFLKVPFLALPSTFSLVSIDFSASALFPGMLALPCLAWTVCKICMWHFFIFGWNGATEPLDEVSLPGNNMSASPDTSLLFYPSWPFALLLGGDFPLPIPPLVHGWLWEHLSDPILPLAVTSPATNVSKNNHLAHCLPHSIW